jgi:hypothetical protein
MNHKGTKNTKGFFFKGILSEYTEAVLKPQIAPKDKARADKETEHTYGM